MTRTLAIAACLGLLGCAGDPARSMKTDMAVRSRITAAIVADTVLARAMADTLVRDAATRGIVIERIRNHGDAMQLLMAQIARDPTAVDGIIGFAVQESTMKEHVLTLLKGMQIGEGAAR